VLSARLSGEGFHIRSAFDAEGALGEARAWRPHVILLDYRMEGLNGLEILSALRRHAATSRVPVIMLSANMGPLEREQAVDLGAAGILNKPYDPKVLVEALRTAIQEAQPSAM
jgi:CheY-like chemotaxis protein